MAFAGGRPRAGGPCRPAQPRRAFAARRSAAVLGAYPWGRGTQGPCAALQRLPAHGVRAARCALLSALGHPAAGTLGAFTTSLAGKRPHPAMNDLRISSFNFQAAVARAGLRPDGLPPRWTVDAPHARASSEVGDPVWLEAGTASGERGLSESVPPCADRAASRARAEREPVAHRAAISVGLDGRDYNATPTRTALSQVSGRA